MNIINFGSFSREGKLFVIASTLWAITILGFLSSFMIVHSVVGVVDFSQLPKGNSNDLFMISFLINILVGIIAFFLSTFYFLKISLNKKSYTTFRIFSPINIIMFGAVSIVLLTLFTAGTSMIISGDSKTPVLGLSDDASKSSIVEVDWNTEILNLINEERKKQNLSPLMISPQLNESASNRNKSIFASNKWEIKSSDGKDYTYYLSQAGYKYIHAAESQIKNFFAPSEAVIALMADKTNNENILNKNFKEVGIYSAEGSFQKNKSRIIVIHFGNPEILYGSAQTKVTKSPVDKVDPVINCDFQYLPDQQMKQSECNISFECQIGGQWYIYKDKNKCASDQKISSSQSNNYTPPVNPIKPLISCLVYYPCSNTSYTYQMYSETCTEAQISATNFCNNLKNEKHDCKIDGNIIPNLTSEECTQAINAYYQQPLAAPTDNRQDRIKDCLNKFRALGTIDSSEARKCYDI